MIHPCSLVPQIKKPIPKWAGYFWWYRDDSFRDTTKLRDFCFYIRPRLFADFQLTLSVFGYVFQKYIWNHYHGWWMRFNYLAIHTGVVNCTTIRLALPLWHLQTPDPLLCRGTKLLQASWVMLGGENWPDFSTSCLIWWSYPITRSYQSKRTKPKTALAKTLVKEFLLLNHLLEYRRRRRRRVLSSSSISPSLTLELRALRPTIPYIERLELSYFPFLTECRSLD